jgi:uncharacterized repeat protein (TIGR03803 family)
MIGGAGMPAFARFGLIIAAAATLTACAGNGSQNPIGLPLRTAAPNLASESVIYSFAGGNDGADPQSAPILIHGQLYGTTALGGNGGCGFVHGCGTVYSLSASGQERLLHVFKSAKDGEAPSTALIEFDGNLRGTTSLGGGPACEDGHVKGCGTVFEVTPSGREGILYRFPGKAQGARPASNLMYFKDNFYGEAAAGGTGKCYYTNIRGCGLIFKMDPGGRVHDLYTFKGGESGGTPQGGLLLYKGKFYGTTSAGGDDACMFSYGCGTAFELTPSGTLKILHAFGRTVHDAALPATGLAMLHGAFYGTTESGGTHDCALTGSFLGCGTVFKLTPTGKFTLLYSFTGGSDGAYPNGLVAANGNLYGTAGSTYGCGTVFEVTPSGHETTLYQFKGSDGCAPASLTYAGGAFYGTTEIGGTYNSGTVFTLSP